MAPTVSPAAAASVHLFDPRLPARFWDKVIPEPNSGCWLWLGSVEPRGYGRYIHTPGRIHRAHKVAYETLVGTYSERDLDHRCRLTCCVNPAHLEPATQRVNILRGTSFSAVNAAKTTCPKGHPYDMRQSGGGGRGCRECFKEVNRAKAKRRYRRLKAQGQS